MDELEKCVALDAPSHLTPSPSPTKPKREASEFPNQSENLDRETGGIGGFQLNPQRVKDFEIPLFRLEQKVQKLESAVNVRFDFGKMADILSKKIDDAADIMLPSVMKKVNQIKGIRDKLDILQQKFISDSVESGSNKVMQEIKGLRF